MYVSILLIGLMHGTFSRFFHTLAATTTGIGFAVDRLLRATSIEPALTEGLGGPITLIIVTLVWYGVADAFAAWVYERPSRAESVAPRLLAGP